MTSRSTARGIYQEKMFSPSIDSVLAGALVAASAALIDELVVTQL